MLKRLFEFREGDGEAVKPFLDHLEDLRWMLIKMAVTLGLAMAIALALRHRLIQLLEAPLHTIDERLAANLQSLGVTDSITISFTLAFYSGIVFAFPLLLYFLAGFVLPALNRQEKKFVLPALTAGFALFIGGVLASYFWVLPHTLAFFFQDAHSMGWQPMWTVHEYFSFATQITLVFGLAAELPMFVLGLVFFGFISAKFMRQTRPYAFVIILCLAAVIAPTPDPMTFLALGSPMCLLYEACIWMAWFVDRRRQTKLTS